MEDKKKIIEGLESVLRLTRQYAEITLTPGNLGADGRKAGYVFIPCDSDFDKAPYVEISSGRDKKLVCIEADSGSSLLRDILRGVWSLYREMDATASCSITDERLASVAFFSARAYFDMAPDEAMFLFGSILNLSDAEMKFLGLEEFMNMDVYPEFTINAE